ncbi:MAG: hypothetical protein M3295_01760 [Chloroflexota bacterium]|nr:hypothetical protein [Chloroflexota bacterium]
MSDDERFPAIDDPAMPGGAMPAPRATPAGDDAGDTAPTERPISELDLPGPDDPVAWRYVKPGTNVVGPDGEQVGTVDTMLGSDQEDIFHGIAVRIGLLGAPRLVRADDVVDMTPAAVTIRLDATALAEAPEHRPAER